MNPIMPADDHVLTSLKAVGLGPDDIDVVVCSHLHTDHCGCNEFFKKATIFVHALEIEAANASDAFDRGYIRADWDHPIPLQVIDRQTDVFGDGRLTLVPLPGHSKGTTGALVKLDRSGEFLLASDALSVRANLDPENRTQKYPGRRTVLEISRRDSEAGSGRRADHLRP